MWRGSNCVATGFASTRPLTSTKRPLTCWRPNGGGGGARASSQPPTHHPVKQQKQTPLLGVGGQTGRRTKWRGAVGRGQSEELHAADRAANSRGAAYQGIWPGFFPASHRRAPRPRRLSRRDARQSVQWGEVDPTKLPDAIVCYTDTT